jgi:hypothetical protein
MSRVIDAEIVTVPRADGWQWRREVTDFLTFDGAIVTDSLPAAGARTLGELLDAKLIRISAAACRGKAKGVRRVFPTDAGREWWLKGVRARRGCSNKNARGGSDDRRRRRQWLLDTYGDGTTAPCWLAVPGVCTGPVNAETISVERVTPGHAGGSYRRDNIRPACSACQSHQGGQFAEEKRRQRARETGMIDMVAAAACST